MKKLTPARAASLLAGASTLGLALSPAIANLDTTSAASCLGGVIGILVILERFLVGQRAHEARVFARTPATATIDTGNSGSGVVVTTNPPPVPVAPARRRAPAKKKLAAAKPPEGQVTS